MHCKLRLHLLTHIQKNRVDLLVNPDHCPFFGSFHCLKNTFLKCFLNHFFSVSCFTWDQARYPSLSTHIHGNTGLTAGVSKRELCVVTSKVNSFLPTRVGAQARGGRASVRVQGGWMNELFNREPCQGGQEGIWKNEEGSFLTKTNDETKWLFHL